MRKLPLVSILTPSYNQGEFIEDAILSIKNQDYPNLEHIIIDGASTDNTLAIIKKHEGTYNMHWISEPDSGFAEAVNKGLCKAQGEIWAVVPADDLQLPWSVSVAVEYFKHHPEVEEIYGDMISMHLKRGVNRLAFYPQVSLPFLIGSRPGLPLPAAFFRKSVVEKVGLFDENTSPSDDYEYSIRVAKQCMVSKIEEVLAVERHHLKNVRARQRQLLLEKREAVKQSYGAPKGMRRYLFKIAGLLRFLAATRFLSIKFAFYYWTKRRKTSSEGSLTYPWQNLMEFSGFRVVSWVRFFIMMIPWASMNYKGNWFILDLERESGG